MSAQTVIVSITLLSVMIISSLNSHKQLKIIYMHKIIHLYNLVHYLKWVKPRGIYLFLTKKTLEKARII